ncbi:hypothetical protein RB601_008571 [Gaeumannomyces tritici]
MVAMPGLLIWTLLVFVATSVHAVALGPKATAAATTRTISAVVALHNSLHGGDGPRPTAPAAIHELLRRQGNDDIEYVVAPDNTCGYIYKSEDELQAVCTAQPSGRCVMMRNVALTSGIIGCCDGKSCSFATECVPYRQIEAGNCDEKCMANANALICSSSASPYCNIMSYTNGVTDYFCSATQVLLRIPARTTRISGPARIYATLTSSHGVDFNTVGAPFMTATTSSTRAASSSTATTDAPAAASTTANGSQGDDGAAAPTVAVGALVGCALGGAAAIATVVAGLLFWRRRKAKRATAAAGAVGNSDRHDAAELPDQPAAAELSDKAAAGMTMTPTIPVIHEASGSVIGAARDQNNNHRGEIYELP